jgi:hypothetical protein
MDITPQRFVRKPLYVEGVQVSAENMVEVAAWCGGTIRHAAEEVKKNPYIKLESAVRGQPSRQTMAFPKDWVLSYNGGFKVYTQMAFAKTFDPVNEEVTVS